MRVVGRRPDGYHDIDALMVAVTEPHDTLEIEEASAHLAGRRRTVCRRRPCRRIELGVAWRWTRWAYPPRCDCTREFRTVPVWAADRPTRPRCCAAFGAAPEVAAGIGADVPFCMYGGAARVRGIGDVVEPVDQPETFVVIATPRFSCATADVYRAWDELGGPHAGPNELGVGGAAR